MRPRSPAAGSTRSTRRSSLVACAGLSLYAIYWVLNPVPAQRYRTSFLLVALAMTFLVYRGWGRAKSRRSGRALASPTGCSRSARSSRRLPAGHVRRVHPPRCSPNDLDVVFGAAFLLVLEATRRTMGWVLPAVVLAFLGYAYYGGDLPQDWRSRTAATISTRSSARYWAAGHLRRAARRGRHLHHPVHDLRRRTGGLRRRRVLHRPRSPPTAADRPRPHRRWPASCWARSPDRAPPPP